MYSLPYHTYNLYSLKPYTAGGEHLSQISKLDDKIYSQCPPSAPNINNEQFYDCYLFSKNEINTCSGFFNKYKRKAQKRKFKTINKLTIQRLLLNVLMYIPLGFFLMVE